MNYTRIYEEVLDFMKTRQGIVNNPKLYKNAVRELTGMFCGIAYENDVPEEDVINFKNELQEFPDVFVTYKDLGYTAEFDGTDDFEGTEVYKVKITKTPYLIDGEENPNIDYYLFDMDNYVLLAVWSEMLEGPGKGAVIQQSFSDYQEVEGVYYPFSLTFGAKGQPGGQTFVVQSMEINPELDDSDFKFPEEENQE